MNEEANTGAGADHGPEVGASDGPAGGQGPGQDSAQQQGQPYGHQQQGQPYGYQQQGQPYGHQQQGQAYGYQQQGQPYGYQQQGQAYGHQQGYAYSQGQAYGQQPYGYAPHPSGLPSEVRNWGLAAHLGALGLGLISLVLGFVAPLVVWTTKRDDHPFIDHHAKESLNFQLTVLAAMVASVALAIPVVALGVITFGIAFAIAAVVMVAAVIAWIVFPIIGAVKAVNGQGYRYPVSIRFIS